MKEEHEECQGGKPALEQTTSQQSESNWQSVHDPTVPVPISRVEAKVDVCMHSLFSFTDMMHRLHIIPLQELEVAAISF